MIYNYIYIQGTVIYIYRNKHINMYMMLVYIYIQYIVIINIVYTFASSFMI